jgi:cytochrome P450
LLQQSPSLARAAFEESIRLESPVQTFFRTTVRAMDVAGILIPEGKKVLLFLGAANRDPRRWSEPDRLDIKRNCAGHVGFGWGIHACVGQMVARLEGESVLTALARRVRRIHMLAEPLPRFNNTLRGWNSLPVEVELI